MTSHTIPFSSTEHRKRYRDRRQSERLYPYRKTYLLYRCPKSEVEHLGRVINLSQHGIQFISNVSFDEGSPIHLNLKLPGMEETLDTDACVVWRRPSADPRFHYQYGAHLEDLRHHTLSEGFMFFMAETLCRLSIFDLKPFLSHPASSLEELQASYRIVYKEYTARGYCPPNPAEMLFSHYCFLPQSRTFVTSERGHVTGTVTAIPDSLAGLPMESIFRQEVNQLRNSGRVGEVSLLAVDQEATGQNLFSLADFKKHSLSFSLFKMIFHYFRVSGLTDILIAVHPKHTMLYRYMSFEPLGDVRDYQKAEGNPAIPMRCNLDRLVRNPEARGFVKYLFHDKPREDFFRAAVNASPEALRFFVKGLLWPRLTRSQRDLFEAFYPETFRSSAA
jgi:hypothetical protein